MFVCRSRNKKTCINYGNAIERLNIAFLSFFLCLSQKSSKVKNSWENKNKWNQFVCRFILKSNKLEYLKGHKFSTKNETKIPLTPTSLFPSIESSHDKFWNNFPWKFKHNNLELIPKKQGNTEIISLKFFKYFWLYWIFLWSWK